MTINELNNITKLTNKRKIERALRNCAKHRQLRRLSLWELARAEKQGGDEYLTADKKRLFDGQISAHVETAEQYEFIVINIYNAPSDPDGEAEQTDILIWARTKK